MLEVHKSRTVFLISEDVRCVKGMYEPESVGHMPKVEEFKTFATDIVVDDIIVVQSGTRHGYTTVKVVEIDVKPDMNGKEMKWAVGRVDIPPFEKMLEQEAEMLKKVEDARQEKMRRELAENLKMNTGGVELSLSLKAPE